MKKEDLFDGFGSLDDALLERSEQDRNQKQYHKKRWIKIGSIAACLVVIFGAGAFGVNNSRQPNSDVETGNHIGAGNSDTVSNERYVDVSTLLRLNTAFTMTEQELRMTFVEIGEYSAIYEQIKSVKSSRLKVSIGSEVEGVQNWYRVSGHEDMQYLILKENDTYSLWKFNSFQSENYSYNDVLQIIYNINSAEDIEKIIVFPANMDNSDAGKELQNEIGTHIITDDASIQFIYQVLTGLTCYGCDNWEMVGFDDTTLLHQVRVGRYLTFVTSEGMEIDTLKYTGLSNMFYEYGGIAYSALSVEEKTRIEEILKIE